MSIRKLISHQIFIAGCLFGLTLLIYSISSRGEGAPYNYFVRLAEAMLEGRLSITNPPPWLNELAFWKGNWYVIYPPLPALLLLPFVALFGMNVYQPLLSILLGSANVAIVYLFFLKLMRKQSLAIWMSLLFGFGTMQWYHAEVGSVWYVGQIVALFFIWLSLLEVVTKQRLFLIGLLIGCAYLARLPTILSVVFILIFLHQHFIQISSHKITFNWKNGLILFGGLLPAVILNAGYNYIRFQTPFDKGYSLLPIFDEPWYRYGLFSIRYIPTHLNELFTAMPTFVNHWPFVVPSLRVMALWVVTPAFMLIPYAKFSTRIGASALVAAIICALPSLMHGGVGFTQFGYRYAFDYLPFLLILVATTMERKVYWYHKLLIILSILINLWGVYMITFAHLWTL